MEVVNIHSTQFVKLNGVTKDLINMGEWFLYKINYDSIPSAKYYLATDQMGYFLEEDGRIVAKTPITPEDLTFLNQIFFDDLPKPRSLQNMVVQWA